MSKNGLRYNDTDRSRPLRVPVPPTGQLLALQVLIELVLELLCKRGERFGDSRELSNGAMHSPLDSSAKSGSRSSFLSPTISGSLAFLRDSDERRAHSVLHNLLFLV